MLDGNARILPLKEKKINEMDIVYIKLIIIGALIFLQLKL